MATIAKPRISRANETSGSLPSFFKNVQGKLVIDKKHIDKGARVGPYDSIMDFGSSRNRLKGIVPKEQRLIGSMGDVTILGFNDPLIRQAMTEVSDLANDPERSWKNSSDRKQYREKLRQVYEAMAGEVINLLGGNEALVFPPKNGGIFVQEVFQQVGFPSRGFFDYRMSRIHTNDHELMLGVALAENNPDIANYRRFVFADDCMASDISTFGTLEMIKEALIAKGVPLSEAEVIIAVSAMSQRGIESLLSQESLDYFGFGSIKVVAGVPVYKMNDNFYLLHPDGRFVVGDMGHWTQT